MVRTPMRRFELVSEGHAKFWEVKLTDASFTVRFGRTGASGTAKSKTLASHQEASDAVRKLVREKTSKGYVEILQPLPTTIIEERVAQASAHGSVFASLSALWAEKRPQLEGGLRPGATSVELASFDKQLGLPLPETFRAMYAWHDGAEEDERDCFEGSYGFLRLEFILSLKQMLDQVRGGDGTWEKSWVPFLENASSDHVCIDTGTGDVFEWFNYGRPGGRIMLAPTFDQWLAQHLALTKAAKSPLDDANAHAAFSGPKAARVRATVSPGYPKGQRR